MTQQDGILYDFEIVFHGTVIKTFDKLLMMIEKELIDQDQTQSERFKIAQKLFFDYRDDLNSQRVVNKIKEILG